MPRSGRIVYTHIAAILNSAAILDMAAIFSELIYIEKCSAHKVHLL